MSASLYTPWYLDFKQHIPKTFNAKRYIGFPNSITTLVKNHLTARCIMVFGCLFVSKNIENDEN